MFGQRVAARVVTAAAVLALPALLLAQRAEPSRPPVRSNGGIDLSNARPGRDPNQPVDEEYTKKIKEYTTEPFFLSPLVDYLPSSKNVPTPKAVLGDIAGAPGKLPYSKDVHDYMRLLEKATPRVKVFSIGKSEEGREMIAVAVASEALMARLDANRADLEQLADPRRIKMNDTLAEEIARRAAPVYYITGTIHSPEAGAPTALMELAYRLAVDEAPYIRNIRENLITLITPVVEVDGRDRVVDLYNYRKKYPDRTVPNLLYWGKYVAHDNNRDAMGVMLKLTENVMNTYVGWRAQVLHDLHESVPYLYDNTIGDGPYNAWLDPLLTNEWHLIGWHNVNEMTRMGMPGVFAFGTFDTWSPGYLMFIAATHNGISRLYETFGNGGSADTQERTLAPNQTSRTWYRQNPPLPKVMWSLRNNNNYEQTGVLISLNHFATNRLMFLRNFYEKSKRSILKARTEGPAAYVLPANDPRLGAQAELLRVLQRQHVEISKATAAFTVQVRKRGSTASTGPAGPGSSGSTGTGRGGAAGDETQKPETQKPAPVQLEPREFPAGSYIIRMDQPYSRIADALLDYQYWAPNDPQQNPYDDTGWTFPEGFQVQSIRVTDPTVLDVPVEAVGANVRAPGGITGTGSTFAVAYHGDTALLTLRYRLRNADFQVAEEPFEAAGQKFGRGSVVIRNVSTTDLDAAAKELGVKVVAIDAAPTVKTHPARAARVALMHTWQSTQTEGWWRLALDGAQLPYDYISVQDVARDGNLRSKYDVIMFAPGGGGGIGIIEGLPMFRNPMPWKRSAETPNIGTYAETDDIRPGLGWDGLKNLETFIRNGGVFLAASSSATFAVQYGLAHGVSTNTAATGSRVVGSLLRTKIVDDTSPLVYGIADSLAVYSESGASFSVSAGGGGGGGRGGGPGGQRPTGRGTPDDPDIAQGRPAMDPRFEAATTPSVSPWQYAIPTEEQLRQNPLNVIPPQYRPRVALRFADQRELLVSGLLQGGGDIAQRPVVVDVPVEQGHVVLFANNPLWRGSTVGSYALVFNAILNFDHLNAGRKLDVR